MEIDLNILVYGHRLYDWIGVGFLLGMCFSFLFQFLLEKIVFPLIDYLFKVKDQSENHRDA